MAGNFANIKDYRFKPGQSGNPSGRPKLPEHLRFIQSFSGHEVEKIFAKYLRMTKDELQEIVRKDETPMIDLCVAQLIAQAAIHADVARFTMILDRTIGRVPNEPMPETNDVINELREKTNQELIDEAQRYIEMLKDA